MAKIIGMSRERIVDEAGRLLTNPEAYQDMSEGDNPYGDGKPRRELRRRYHAGTRERLRCSSPARNSSYPQDLIHGAAKLIPYKMPKKWLLNW